ncbi:MAG: response regulator transcription factor [Deltaproteobacteria bacterium]|nr:response regulator transcription factor [Deltaproteobacteria bacterium]
MLVDNHTLVRAGIRSLLEGLTGVEVVGEAADGREALVLIKERNPDIVFMDVAMEGMNGLEATRRAVKSFPRVRVIVLSIHSNEEYVSQALRAGASGYMLKDAAPSELEIAINAVANRATYLSPAVSRQVVDDYLRRVSDEEATPVEMLTPRQREVLQLVAEGCSTKEVAQKLDLGIKTVETHRTQLMERLGIHDIAGLVRYAIRQGLVSPER